MLDVRGRSTTAVFLVLGAALAAAASGQSLFEDPLDQATRVPRIAFGPVVAGGDDHPLFDLADFPISVKEAATLIDAQWVEGSVRWVRTVDGFPVPLARLRITLRSAPERTLLRWRDRAVLLQIGTDGASAEVFVPLLDGGEARVEADGRLLARVEAASRPAVATPLAARHAIDHSCSPWNIAIAGADDAFISMDCRMIPVGRVGREESLLAVRWVGAGIALPDGSHALFSAQLRDSRPARATVVGPDGKTRVIEISATVPRRWNRLRLAAGIGPYHLSSSAGAGNGAATSVMLYGNLRLRTDDDLSLRAFEAAVSQSPSATAFFNNFGVYFAYDLAGVWDDRLHMVALLGMQGVTFAPAGLSHQTYTEALFPQGFEISYLDAFGLRNKRLTLGIFLQPTTTKSYDNFWIRYGGRVFGELNYISWQSTHHSAKMWGISVGVPFAQFF